MRFPAQTKGRSRLLLVEVIVPDDIGDSALEGMIVGTDLNMLVNTGGKERTEKEFRELLEASGLYLQRTIETPAALAVLEARR